MNIGSIENRWVQWWLLAGKSDKPETNVSRTAKTVFQWTLWWSCWRGLSGLLQYSELIYSHFCAGVGVCNKAAGAYLHILRAVTVLSLEFSGKVFICKPIMKALSVWNTLITSEGSLKGTLMAIKYRPASGVKRWCEFFTFCCLVTVWCSVLYLSQKPLFIRNNSINISQDLLI